MCTLWLLINAKRLAIKGFQSEYTLTTKQSKPFRAKEKTMKENTKNQIEEMKKQTIGVEIEMADITRENAIKTIAEYFHTEDSVKYIGGAYRAWTCKDNKGRTWTITRDSSIEARNDDEKAELGTPILHYEDIEDLQQIARNLRHKGAVSNPAHDCGVHVHIGANGQTPKTIRNLANIMKSHEDLIAEALNLDSHRLSRWCQTVDERFLTELNKKKPKTMAALADVWYESQGAGRGRSDHYNKSRYHMLNLHATFTKGTIEFRLFQFQNPHDGKKGGIHAGELKTFIQFALALTQMAKEVRSASPKKQQHENPRFAMRTWLLRLGFIGDEFKTARDILTQRLSGDTAFRFGRAA